MKCGSQNCHSACDLAPELAAMDSSSEHCSCPHSACGVAWGLAARGCSIDPRSSVPWDSALRAASLRPSVAIQRGRGQCARRLIRGCLACQHWVTAIVRIACLAACHASSESDCVDGAKHLSEFSLAAALGPVLKPRSGGIPPGHTIWAGIVEIERELLSVFATLVSEDVEGVTRAVDLGSGCHQEVGGTRALSLSDHDEPVSKML